jgi:D-xylose transport system permease protein
MSEKVTSLASGNEGTVKDQINDYFSRVRSGQMGSLPAVAGVIILSIVFAVASPFFVTKLNFANLLEQSAELVMLSSALVFVILIGEIDLAAGVTGGVAMGVFIDLYLNFHFPWILALVVGFIVGLAIGWMIGFLVGKIGVPSFVVSLAFFLGFQGLQLILLGNGAVDRLTIGPLNAILNNSMPGWLGWAFLIVCAVTSALISFWDRARRTRTGLVNKPLSLIVGRLLILTALGAVAVFFLNGDRSQGKIPITGVPIVVPVVVVILAIGTFVLDRTRFGRHLYAVGGNAEAARRAGIKVVRVKITAFMICGFLSVVSGVFYASRLGSIDPTMGHTIVLSGVAAAVVGGVSLFGGRGRLFHAAIGAIVITMINNGLGLLQMPDGISFLVQGGVLLAAATIDALARRRNGVVARN